ncbi:hypothetical protein GCM10020367_08210 [Streptomyces sannanensis]|uniref:Uncharacterized protein n=1 Tax=Streptomyces sannanensis TaxID=285536 RepID=A0ABP6S5R3_9ACTN
MGLPTAAVLVVLWHLALWHLALVPWSEDVPDGVRYGPYSASQLFSTPLRALLVAAAQAGPDRPAHRPRRGVGRAARALVVRLVT